MKLTTKGLLLIAVPAVFELTLLSGLVEAQIDAQQAERRALRSEDLLSETSAILKPVLLQAARLRGAVIVGDGRSETPLSLWVDIDSRIDRLAQLVADNPAQVARAAQVRAAVQAYRQWSERIEDLLRSGRRADVRAYFDDLNASDPLDQFRLQVAAFQAEERRLDALRSDEVDAAHARQQALAFAAAAGSVLFVLVAIWLFARGLRGRLARLSDNARRLAGNEPLAPAAAGDDEIGRLDQILHATGRRLLESERAQASFHADLARRADELAHTNETLRQQTQENEMFIYSVSHDLRSPLVNLQGFSRELGETCNDLREAVRQSSLTDEARARIERLIDEDIEEAIRYLQSAVLRASHIIDALLRLSRVGRVEYRPQVVEVRDVVQRVIDSMQASIRARGAQLSVLALPAVWGDPTALEQIFANLIGNALNYLSPARPGRIEIGTRAAPPGVQSLHIFYVRDNGLGIPEVAMPRLFSAFQRLHGNVAPGEGVGLALVRRMVERHGGRVWAESTEDVGSTFYLSLPETLPALSALAVREAQQPGGAQLPVR